MIDHYTIRAAPAVSHKEIMKSFEIGTRITPEHTNKLTKVKVKIEFVGEYADADKVRSVLKELSK